MDTLGIEGVRVFTTRTQSDERGIFLKNLYGDEIAADVGHQSDATQATCSVSRCGVVREVHFVGISPGPAKNASCLHGPIFDVVIDPRLGSSGFGGREAVHLDDQNLRSDSITEGLGCAFVALTEEATVFDLCSAPDARGKEHRAHPLDPDLDRVASSGGVRPVRKGCRRVFTCRGFEQRAASHVSRLSHRQSQPARRGQPERL